MSYASWSHSRRLHRSETNSLVAGVCGGIADTYGWDATLLRILFVLSWMIPGPQLIFYFVAWLLLPKGQPMMLPR